MKLQVVAVALLAVLVVVSTAESNQVAAENGLDAVKPHRRPTVVESAASKAARKSAKAARDAARAARRVAQAAKYAEFRKAQRLAAQLRAQEIAKKKAERRAKAIARRATLAIQAAQRKARAAKAAKRRAEAAARRRAKAAARAAAAKAAAAKAKAIRAAKAAAALAALKAKQDAEAAATGADQTLFRLRGENAASSAAAKATVQRIETQFNTWLASADGIQASAFCKAQGFDNRPEIMQGCLEDIMRTGSTEIARLGAMAEEEFRDKSKVSNSKKYCVAAGDPHFTTYDGESLHLQEQGVFTLVRSSDFELQEYAVKSNGRNVAGVPSCLRSIAVRYKGVTIEVDTKTPSSVLVNGRSQELPSDFTLKVGGVSVRRGSQTLEWRKKKSTARGIKISAPNGFGVMMIGGRCGTVEVNVPKEYFGKVSGVCGNADGKRDANDFVNPSGVAMNVLRGKRNWQRGGYNGPKAPLSKWQLSWEPVGPACFFKDVCSTGVAARLSEAEDKLSQAKLAQAKKRSSDSHAAARAARKAAKAARDAAKAAAESADKASTGVKDALLSSTVADKAAVTADSEAKAADQAAREATQKAEEVALDAVLGSKTLTETTKEADRLKLQLIEKLRTKAKLEDLRINAASAMVSAKISDDKTAEAQVEKRVQDEKVIIAQENLKNAQASLASSQGSSASAGTAIVASAQAAVDSAKTALAAAVEKANDAQQQVDIAATASVAAHKIADSAVAKAKAAFAASGLSSSPSFDVLSEYKKQLSVSKASKFQRSEIARLKKIIRRLKRTIARLRLSMAKSKSKLSATNSKKGKKAFARLRSVIRRFKSRISKLRKIISKLRRALWKSKRIPRKPKKMGLAKPKKMGLAKPKKMGLAKPKKMGLAKPKRFSKKTGLRRAITSRKRAFRKLVSLVGQFFLKNRRVRLNLRNVRLAIRRILSKNRQMFAVLFRRK